MTSNETRHQLQKIENQEYKDITLVTDKEVADAIKNNLNPKKAPGFDLITGEVLKQLPGKGIANLPDQRSLQIETHPAVGKCLKCHPNREIIKANLP